MLDYELQQLNRQRVEKKISAAEYTELFLARSAQLKKERYPTLAEMQKPMNFDAIYTDQAVIEQVGYLDGQKNVVVMGTSTAKKNADTDVLMGSGVQLTSGDEDGTKKTPWLFIIIGVLLLTLID